MIPILILIGFVPAMRWKQDKFPRIIQQVWLPLLSSIAIGVIVPFFFHHWSIMVAVGLACASWILLTAGQSIVQRVRNTAKGNSLPLSFFGMHLAHIGLAVTVVGVTLVMAYETENDLRMEINQTTKAAGYEIKFLGVQQIQGPNYTAEKGKFEVTKNNQFIEFLEPEKRQYVNSGMPMTEAAIDSGFTRDVYVSLGSLLTDKGAPAWSVRVYYKPFVNWIWWGTLLMAIGGIASTLDKRYRKKKSLAAASVSSTATLQA
jgi:cytochrome c-type biogenesis protein CcmF